MEGIATDIYMSGKKSGRVERYAIRRFKQVPRVGEFVKLRKDGAWECAEVVRVQYDEIDSSPFEQTCVIFVKWEKP